MTPFAPLRSGTGGRWAQVAYAWVASRPGVTAPIVGISRVTQLDDPIAALDLKLTQEDIAELEAPYRPKLVAGHS